ncbi:MAG: hypothetical protein F4X97_07260 [Boseongicola sp. SB0662_bin_57]|nr:hypothetical protein [Boseongicola sp. SB0662_bin_57]
MTGTGDGVLAWKVLRRVPECREAWSVHGTAHGLEPGPFRIRVQAEADLEAARFGLLAWKDPWAEDGPASPFWWQVAGVTRNANGSMPCRCASGIRVAQPSFAG